MIVVGGVFVLVSIILLYADSFSGMLVPLYALPTFNYFLPRLIDFLFYGGLILMTVSVVQAQRKEKKSKGIIVEQQESSVGKADVSRMTLEEIRQKYATS